ncbi:MAG: rRNA maturation RNase YbeY [Bacillota bacterium]
MEIMIDNRQNRVQYNQEIEALIQKVIEKCLMKEGLNDTVEISISFVDNDEIRKLNKQFRGLDKSTDVLSFPMFDRLENIEGIVCLGDIVLSLEKAVEQSLDYGHSFEREIAFLVTHSMFHLFGYDHDTDENTKIMRQKEEEVLEALGILRK